MRVERGDGLGGQRLLGVLRVGDAIPEGNTRSGPVDEDPCIEPSTTVTLLVIAIAESTDDLRRGKRFFTSFACDARGGVAPGCPYSAQNFGACTLVTGALGEVSP